VSSHTAGEGGVAFTLPGPPPQRDTAEGWAWWRASRHAFVPAPRLDLAAWRRLSPRQRILHELVPTWFPQVGWG
jgi:hypothetical protein